MIAGAGAAGLFAAPLLARDHHEVVVIDQEPWAPAPDVESAAACAFRPSAPQIVQPHAIMARCRELLRDRLPDVYERLLAAGAAEAPPGRSRHYRLRPGGDLPGLPATRVVLGLDEFTAALFGADNGAMQVAVAPLAADRRFRAVRDPEVFTAVLRTIPAFAAWLEVMDPISPVFPMAGLHNTLRRLIVDGAPVVTGLHAIGDSVCTTNPTFGRGLSLALCGACDLVDTLGQHPEDPIAQALVLGEHLDDHVAPYYEDQATIDSARLAMLRHAIFGAPPPVPPPEARDRVTYAQLRTAAASDPVAFRAFWKIHAAISRPGEVYADPEVVAVTHEALGQPRRGPPMAQPSRDQLLAALAGRPP